MNFRNLLLAFSIVSIVIISCKSTPENPEVENYVKNTMPTFMKEELAIMKEFDSLTNVKKINKPNADTVVRSITIPKYTKFIEKLDTMTIKDTALLNVHQQYINVTKLQLENLSYFISTVNMETNQRSDSLMQKISLQKSMMSNWNRDIRMLCKKYDIEFLGN
jgi:hypothetical protein